MTRDEVKQILIIIEIAFPNFVVPVEKKKAMVNLWERQLGAYDYKVVEEAVDTFINTSGSAFAPSLPQIIEMLHKPTELAVLTEGEAWAMVSRALRNSAYHSQEEFDKLPADIQKAVGAPSMLYAWATDDGYNESVVMSNFQRAYNVVVERRLEEARMPQVIKDRIEQIKVKMIEEK